MTLLEKEDFSSGGTVDLKQYKWKAVVSPVKVKNIAFTSNIITLLNTEITFFGSTLSLKEKESFFEKLGSLLDTGVDIRTALDLVIDSQKKEKNKSIFIKIKEEIVGGSSLCSALKNSGKFSAYDYYTVQIGEEIGKLGEVLLELSFYYAKQIAQTQQIISAVTYPVIVILTAIGAVYFMLNFVVPMFSDVFLRFGKDLPAITKMIIELSGFISFWLPYAVTLLMALVILGYLKRNKQWFRKMTSLFVLKLPVIGDIVQKVYLARFCTSMHLLTKSQVPLLNAIELVRQMIRYYPIESSLQTISKDIESGKPLYQSMEAFSFYDRELVTLVKLGEEVNQLSVFFDKISRQYTKEVDYKTKMLSTILEPVIILFLGVMVGIILVAMYIPMFQLSTKMF